MKPPSDHGLVAATKEVVAFQGVILLHIHIRDICVYAWFGFVPRIVIAILLGTSFIDPLFRGKFPQENVFCGCIINRSRLSIPT